MASEDVLFSLKSSIDLLAASIEAQITKDASKIKEAQAANARNAELFRAHSDALEEDTSRTKEKNKLSKALNEVTKQVAKTFLNASTSGIKFASVIGATATKGVELELKNRRAAIEQLLTLDTNRMATMSQIQSAEKSLTDTFVGVRDGMQLSADGAAKFASNLKTGFGSEFELTGESLRALVTTGMSTREEFENFRKASGRAGLTSAQFAGIVNKNTLSFQLYGASFAKAAIQAEKLGISLSSLQAAQEGLVTNLDGTIDTVAQLNQLGAQVDFGTLVKVAEQEGPDALMAYAKATIPASMMQSASTRALFKQLGISVEDFMKSQDGSVSAANNIENAMTEAATETGKATDFLTLMSRAAETAKTTLEGVAAAGASAAASLAATALGGRAATILGGIATAVGATAGVISMIPLIIGVVTLLGGLFVKYFGGKKETTTTTGNDIFSDYGSRTLVTPTQTIALNNNDTVIAGTKLFRGDDVMSFGAGALQVGSGDSDLIRKVDNLIAVLSNATTTINVGGTVQTVPRMQLVGVYSRNEVR